MPPALEYRLLFSQRRCSTRCEPTGCGHHRCSRAVEDNETQDPVLERIFLGFKVQGNEFGKLEGDLVNVGDSLERVLDRPIEFFHGGVVFQLKGFGDITSENETRKGRDFRHEFVNSHDEGLGRFLAWLETGLSGREDQN